MLSEILKIIPRLEQKDLDKMSKSLSSRFSKVANSFGKALKKGLALGFAAGFINKLINPLQEVKDAIDRTLGKADDVVTNAKQFGSTTENLLKIRALGNVRGLSNENVDMLLTKFQGAVAQATLNPQDPANSAVVNYIGQKDVAKAFYNFITQLQTMDDVSRTLVQQQVFGEKQVLKMAEFLQDKGFKESAASLTSVNFKAVAQATEKMAGLNDKMVAGSVVNNLNDQIKKARVIGNGTVADMNRSELVGLDRENGQIARSKAAFTADENMQKIQESLEQLTNDVLTALPVITTAFTEGVTMFRDGLGVFKSLASDLRKSPMLKGIKNLFGSGEE